MPSMIICATAADGWTPRISQFAATRSSTVCPCGRCKALADTANHRLLAPSTISFSCLPHW